MTDCARCGRCCDPVTLGFNPTERATEQLRSGENLHPLQRYQYEFFLEHWTVTGGPYPTSEGLPKCTVECDQYHRNTRSCQAQDTKPLICAGFPWYDRDPHHPDNVPIRQALMPQCSYNADVRTMLPFTVITHEGDRVA